MGNKFFIYMVLMMGSALSSGAQNRSVSDLEKEVSRLDRSARAEIWTELGATYAASSSFDAETVMDKAAIAWRNAYSLSRGRKRKELVRAQYEAYLVRLQTRSDSALLAHDWAHAARISRFLCHNRSLYPFKMTDTLSLARLGHADLRMGHLDEELVSLEGALRHGYVGRDGQVVADYGKCLILLGDMKKGAQILEEGLEMFPSSRPVREALVEYHYAEACRQAREGRREEAAEAFRRTLAAHPAHWRSWAGLAVVRGQDARAAREAAVREADDVRFMQYKEQSDAALGEMCDALLRLTGLILRCPPGRKP